MKHLGDFELKTVALRSFVPRNEKPRYCASVFSTQIALHVGFPGDQVAVPLASDGILGAPWAVGCPCRCLGGQALAAGIIENRSLTYLRLDRSLRDTPGGQALGSGAV